MILLQTYFIFIATWVTFCFAAIASYLAQVWLYRKPFSFSDFLRHAIPLRLWLAKSSRTDMLMYIASKFIGKLSVPIYFLFQIASATFIASLINKAIPDHSVISVNIAWIILFAIVLFVVADFANYLSHFLQHFVPVLWELHKVHHSATFLTPLTTERMHPLGDEFDRLVASLLVCLPLAVILAFAKLDVVHAALLLGTANTVGTIIVLDAVRHSHFQIGFGPLDGIFLSPYMHQLHHSYKIEHWDKNFGNKLSIFDWMFGTMVRPRAGEGTPWGLGKPEEADYNTVYGAYAEPLVKIAKLVFGAGGAHQAEQKAFISRVLWRNPLASAAPSIKPAVDRVKPGDAVQ